MEAVVNNLDANKSKKKLVDPKKEFLDNIKTHVKTWVAESKPEWTESFQFHRDDMVLMEMLVYKEKSVIIHGEDSIKIAPFNIFKILSSERDLPDFICVKDEIVELSINPKYLEYMEKVTSNASLGKKVPVQFVNKMYMLEEFRFSPNKFSGKDTMAPNYYYLPKHFIINGISKKGIEAQVKAYIESEQMESGSKS